MLYDEPMSEKDWQAESDARTLATAETIRADAPRLTKATEMARKMAEREEKEKEALSKIAEGKAIYNNSPDLYK